MNLIKILFSTILVFTLISGAGYGAKQGAKKTHKTSSPPQEKKEEKKAALPPKAFSFAPPKGWQCIDDKTQLPAKVEIVYIGTGKAGFTPSLNLAKEETKLSLEEYTNLAKSYHESHPQTKCNVLGSIETKAGVAHILQIDRITQWGPVRFLQASVIRQGIAYVMTATCLEKEFASNYPHFFNAIQTLEIYTGHE